MNKVIGSPDKEMWGLERLASLEEKLTGLLSYTAAKHKTIPSNLFKMHKQHEEREI